MKITVSHEPFPDQINNIAAHFLICLTHFWSNKYYVYIGGSLGLTLDEQIEWEVYTMVYGNHLLACLSPSNK